MNNYSRAIATILYLFSTISSHSQDNDTLRIKEILISGNKRTKTMIIFREMDLKKGDRLSEKKLGELIELDKKRIYNTNLFNSVNVDILTMPDNQVVLLYKVLERWYIYPGVVFELADRNFNDWWVNQGRDINRVNLGLRFRDFNFRGKRDYLELISQIGFQRQFYFRWKIPYIDKKQQNGLSLTVNYLDSRNVGYLTSDHFQQFAEADRILKKSYSGTIVHRYRKSFYSTHAFKLKFSHRIVDDTVLILNPNYFRDSRESQKYFQFDYWFTNDLRNNINYPTKGHYFYVGMQKFGLSIFKELDIINFSFNFNKYWSLDQGIIFASGFTSFLSNPKNQPYEKYFSLGIDENLVRGYEKNLIEGSSYFLWRNSIKKKIFGFVINKEAQLDQIRNLPFRFYPKLFFDLGYVNNYPSYELGRRLTNKLIYGGGLGLDMVCLYDLVIRFEFTYNAEGQTHFAIRTKTDI